MKKILFVGFIALSLFCAVLYFKHYLVDKRENDELYPKGWTVDASGDSVLYTTHGTNVYGHRFGLWRRQDDPNGDLLFLEYSAVDEKASEFEGQNVIVSLDFGDEKVEVELTMVLSGVMGTTQVMYFTNWVVGQELYRALVKYDSVEVRIIGPKEFVDLMDMESDVFSLKGYEKGLKEFYLQVDFDKTQNSLLNGIESGLNDKRYPIQN